MTEIKTETEGKNSDAAQKKQQAQDAEPCGETRPRKWYEDPDGVQKLFAVGVIVLLSAAMYLFAGEELRHAFELVLCGNVRELAEYLRGFGIWAVVVSFLLDVAINAGSVFPTIFLSTANGLIFGLPMGCLISWLAETTGVVLSFFLMRFFFRNTAERLIANAGRLQDIDRASARHGFLWMMLARMMPYFPSGILTAVGAVSRMSTRDYILANLVGKFPSTSLEVLIGHDVVNYQENTMRLALLVAAAALAIFLGRRRLFKNKNDAEKENAQHAEKGNE